MATSQNLDKVYVDAWKADVHTLYMQRDCRLSTFCRIETDVGKEHYFDTLLAGGLTLTPKTAKQKTETKWQDVDMARRRVSASTEDVAINYEFDELYKILMNPSPLYQMELVGLANRAKDKKIFDACVNPAESYIYGATTGTAVPLPAGQQVAGATLSIDVLTEVREKFIRNEMAMEKVYCILDATSYIELLKDAKAINNDFVNDSPITTGELGLRLGFDFIIYNDNKVSGTPTKRNVLFLTGMPVGLINPLALRIEVDELPTDSYMWQIYMAQTLGATRLDEQRVVLAVIGT